MPSTRGAKLLAGTGVVLRTPLLPATTLVDWAAASEPRRFLQDVLGTPEVIEAIFLASPSLWTALSKWLDAPESHADDAVEIALAKYVARMAYRPTPFGLFSGVSTGTLGSETQIELAPRSAYRRRTRLDNHYLFSVLHVLTQQRDLREQLTYRPNSSLYRLGDRLRFVADRVEGQNRRYHLISVLPTEYLDATLERAAPGAPFAELASALVDSEITADEARSYVHDLIDAELLVPELGFYITGSEPIDGLLRSLAVPAATKTRAILADVRRDMAMLDAAGIGNAPGIYLDIGAKIDALGVRADRSRLFQVDMSKPATFTLGKNVVAELARVITNLLRINPIGEPHGLRDFRLAFRERYGDREVSLAEALDEESGLGFESSASPGVAEVALLDGLDLTARRRAQDTSLRALHDRLLRRVGDSLVAGQPELVLHGEDLRAMEADPAVVLPDAFAALVRLQSGDDDVEILLEHVTGPSGARFLGRFCHVSPGVDEIVRDHHRLEESHRPNAIYAEIVHLGDGRIGNILCRPVLRGHEIAFLGVSGAPQDAQITIDDLRVSLVGDRIVLRSRRFGREVIPRLSAAHNYSHHSLGVYRFLCTLASQERSLAAWSWGALSRLPFLPRVRIGRVVVGRTTWNLDESDLAPITTAVRKREGVRGAVAALRKARTLPRYLSLLAGDNELPIDLDNDLLVNVFADELCGKTQARIAELFPRPDRLMVRGPEGRFSNQVIVTFTREPSLDPVAAPREPSRLTRSFLPGSEWLYAKIYCGEESADRVLREAVAPVVRFHGGQWFFLRYRDPQPHLRVRLRGDPARLLGEIAPLLSRAVADQTERRVAHKLVLDTYDRETERYGGDPTIELVEQLFWYDSQAALELVEFLEGRTDPEARWRLTLRGVDSLLEAVGLDLDARARVASHAREQLGREHRADSKLWAQIGKRFVRERAELETVMARNPALDTEHDLAAGFRILAARDARLRELRLRGVEAFAWSLAHMHVNRMLYASQRAQELVLCDLLRRLYAARRAKRQARAAVEGRTS